MMSYSAGAALTITLAALLLCDVYIHGFLLQPQQVRKHGKCHPLAAALSEADKDRLLMGPVGMAAFIVAEMQHFVNESMVEFDTGQRYERKWSMTPEDLLQTGLADQNGTIVSNHYLQATQDMKTNGSLAVDLICNTTRTAFQEGYEQSGLLSALGSAILFFRNYYRTPELLAACERVGLSDYQVAHHITDMYHHRTFRGAYTKTLKPSGKGEIAARIAVGMDVKEEATSSAKATPGAAKEEVVEEEDECLCWSPTTPGVCLHWKSEDEAWRKKRFERIQMEGTRDPRRGGSGTTR